MKKLQRTATWSKETDRWLRLLSRAKRHANVEEGSMAIAAGAAALGLYELLPLTAFLICWVPLALGASLTIGASVKALKRSLRRRRRQRSRDSEAAGCNRPTNDPIARI
jgi:hypothetical protein